MSTSRRRFAQLGVLSAFGTLTPRWALAEIGADEACHPVVEAFIRDHHFQGVILLGRQGKPAFFRLVGPSDIETKKPLALDTRFGLASISKMFTAVTILRLVEQNRLSLDRPIGTYLPWYRKDLGERLTLRRLLANNSGVPNTFSPVWMADASVMDRPMSTVDAVHRYCEADLLFNPGERFDYSLCNWILVLAIVESVTKQEFATATQEITLRPLGLTQTSTEFDDHTAIPYTDTTPPLRIPYKRLPFLAASGGYYSNATDLLEAGHKIFDEHFLKPESFHSLTTRETNAYALGGDVSNIHVGANTVKAAWDTGSAAGYRSLLGHRLDGQGTVVILNHTSMDSDILDQFAYALLTAYASTKTG